MPHACSSDVVSLLLQRLLTGFSNLEDMEDGIGLTTAERVAELTAVRTSLLETQNGELKLLQKELVGVIENSNNSQNSTEAAMLEQRVLAQQQEIRDKDKEISELREIITSRAQNDAAKYRELQEKLRSQTQAEEQKVWQLQVSPLCACA